MISVDQTLRFLHDAIRDEVGPLSSYGSVDSDGRVALVGKVIGAAFDLAVSRRFSSGADVRELTRFVVDCRARYPDEAENVPVREGQALIRATLGEEVLFSHVSQQVTNEACLRLVVWILRDLDLPVMELDGLLAEAARRARDSVSNNERTD
jgi:hypothetical protein